MNIVLITVMNTILLFLLFGVLCQCKTVTTTSSYCSCTAAKKAARYGECLMFKPSECAVGNDTSLQCTYLNKFCRCANELKNDDYSIDLSDECKLSCQKYGCNFNCDTFYTGAWTASNEDNTATTTNISFMLTMVLVFYLVI